MKRSKRIKEKDELEAKLNFEKKQLQAKVKEKHNAIVKSFQLINLVEELTNGPCKDYDRYNAGVLNGDDMTKSNDIPIFQLNSSDDRDILHTCSVSM